MLKIKIIKSKLIFLILIFTACTLKDNDKFEVSKEIINKSPFHLYLEETFEQKLIKNKNKYIIILGKHICKLCEDDVYLKFKEKQKVLKQENLIIITDLNKSDSLFIPSLRNNIVIDSVSNFENYSFPRSYITIYKVNNGDIIDYVYFSNEDELKKFLKNEHLLVEGID